MNIDPGVEERRSDIDAMLTRVEAQEEVVVLLAVESGSRAWGWGRPGSR